MQLRTERRGLLLRLNDNELSNEKLDWKISEQEVIVKAMMVSVKHPEKGVIVAELG